MPCCNCAAPSPAVIPAAAVRNRTAQASPHRPIPCWPCRFPGRPRPGPTSPRAVLLLSGAPGGFRPGIASELQPFVAALALALGRAPGATGTGQPPQHSPSADSGAGIEALLEEIRIAAVVVDGGGRVTFVNGACEELFGLERSTVLGRRFDVVAGLDHATLVRLEQVARMDPENRPRVPAEVRRPDGRRFSLSADIRNAPGHSRHRLCFLYDVTELETVRSSLSRSQFGRMVGSSPSMTEVFQSMAEVGTGDWTVLIEGETGVGKEPVARGIHAVGARCRGPFIAVNAAGLTESLLASQLFGHRKGAFTGAVTDQQGYFEAADGGTLFLDEIADVPIAVQLSLMRVLQEKEIVRLGETRPRKVNVRVLAATNRDLKAEVRAGRFREDLLYRLRVARIRVPALRNRTEDIPMLVESFLAESRAAAGKPVRDVAEDVMARLMAYPWPGNVRELKNAVEHAVIRCRGSVLRVEDLPPELASTTPSGTFWRRPAIDSGLQPKVSERPSPQAATPPPRPPLDASRIIEALKAAGNNRVRAADALGVSRATLYRRLVELGLSRKDDADAQA